MRAESSRSGKQLRAPSAELQRNHGVQASASAVSGTCSRRVKSKEAVPLRCIGRRRPEVLHKPQSHDQRRKSEPRRGAHGERRARTRPQPHQIRSGAATRSILRCRSDLFRGSARFWMRAISAAGSSCSKCARASRRPGKKLAASEGKGFKGLARIRSKKAGTQVAHNGRRGRKTNVAKRGGGRGRRHGEIDSGRVQREAALSGKASVFRIATLAEPVRLKRKKQDDDASKTTPSREAEQAANFCRRRRKERTEKEKKSPLQEVASGEGGRKRFQACERKRRRPCHAARPVKIPAA